MNDFDLSEENIVNLCHSFDDLREAPQFSISDDTDVHILFFKRRDKYSGIRTGFKTAFTSREEFLIYSYLVEEIPVPTKKALSLTQLKVEKCSDAELDNIYNAIRVNLDSYPKLSNVKYACLIVNNSKLNWVFLEDKKNYHSVFWCESESKLFSRSA